MPDKDIVKALVGIPASAVKEEYETIQDCMSRKKVPGPLKLSYSRAGVSAKDRNLAAVISKVAHFLETTLRLFSQLEDHIP